MARTIDTRNIPRTTSRIGALSSLKGTMRFKDSVRISGRFEGEISAGGFLYIDEGAEVIANVSAETVTIAGVVRGNVFASGNLEMLAGGKVYGNVQAAKLRIADGVVFEGTCEMLKNPNSVDVFAAPAEQLKESSRTLY